jgi:putative ABC transport system permease protein
VAGTAALAILTVMVTGVLPALATSGVQPAPALKDGAPGAGSSRRTRWLRQGLIVAEIAGAVTLLIAASLLIRSFAQVLHIDPGVDVDRVLTARISLPAARYPAGESAAFIERMTQRLAAQPGVDAAAATSFTPVGGGGFGLGRVFLAEGWPEPPAVQDVGARWNVITPDYFRVMGIRVVRGRAFTATDRADTTPVIVVTESFAARMFGDEDPIGKRTRSWRDENLLREIVGVVADVRYDSLTSSETPLVYVPHQQNSWGLMNVVLRAHDDRPELLSASLRQTIAALDPLLALAQVRTLADAARASIARERYTTLLLTLLAASALVLAAIGIFGVISHAVSAMRRELGVRIALGAPRRHIYVLILRQGLWVLALGISLGLAGAALTSRVLTSLLYLTPPADPVAYGVTVAMVAAVTVCACLLPARRAANVDPITAIRGVE